MKPLPFEEALDWLSEQPIPSPSPSSSNEEGSFELLRFFEEGLSHQTALVKRGESVYVLKVLAGSGVVATRATVGQQLAAQSGIAPRVHFHDHEKGILLMEFMSGTSPTPGEMNQFHIEQLAGVVRSIHSPELTSRAQSLQKFNLPEFCASYLPDAGNWANQKNQLLAPVIDAFDAQDKELVFCHNDLIVENFLVSNDRLMVLDWEYAQLNFASFDLASVCFYFDLNDSQKDFFLQSYFGRPTTSEENQSLNSATIALLWGDVLWHLAKFGEVYKDKLKRKINYMDQLLDLRVGQI
ncbi:MAG: phosphotransferase [Pseudomonadota bacterium]